MNVCLVPRYRLWVWILRPTLGIGTRFLWMRSLGSLRAIEPHTFTMQGLARSAGMRPPQSTFVTTGASLTSITGGRQLSIAVNLRNGAAVILASSKPVRPSHSARLALPIPGAPRNSVPLHARVRSSAAYPEPTGEQ
jgi:hypothetical protein